MLRHGQEVRYWIDHILGTDRCLLQNVDVCPIKIPSNEENIFTYLSQVVPKTPAQKHAHVLWISEETWRVTNAMVSLRISVDR